MEENSGEQDKQEMNSHVIGHYFKVSEHMRSHANGDVISNDPPPLADHKSLKIMNKLDQGNKKHSYFLRVKTTRFNMGHHDWTSDHEDGVVFKNSSSTSPLSSPTLSPGSKYEHFDDNSASSEEEEDLANCLVMLSKKSYTLSSTDHNNKDENKAAKKVVDKGVFQCKACKKIFNSHQALGGHRASHKKVKGCFAAKLDGIININEENVDEDLIQEEHEPFTDPTRPVSTRKRPKMHECSVCHRVFSSGQALGGHKRCHWLTTSTDNAFIPTFQDLQYQQLCKKPMFTNPHHHQDHQLDLNLNLPAPQHDENHTDDNINRFESSTRFCLQRQLAIANNNQPKTTSTSNGEKNREINKLKKLSDLRDVKHDRGWLQMGIASIDC